MGWETVAGLILQFGLPFAEKMIEKWSAGGPVTLAEFQELKALAAQNAKTILLQRLAAAGIDPDSDKGKILLGLTS